MLEIVIKTDLLFAILLPVVFTLFVIFLIQEVFRDKGIS